MFSLQRSFAWAVLILSGIASQAAPPAVTLVRAPAGGIQPQAAIGRDGVIHLIYYKGEAGAGDIFYVTQAPGAGAFSKPLRVNSKAGSAIAAGSIRGAQLALGKGGRVHVAWDGMGKGAERVQHDGKEEAPLLYTRLKDDGSAFEPERNLIGQAYGLDGGSSVAADLQGNVYVFWHASRPGNTNGEAGRAVFLVRSGDEGRTFAPEAPATSVPTGACGCCGMKAFADTRGNLFALYRGASNMVHRPETLLVSKDRGLNFNIAYAHDWTLPSCPMSSAFLAESPEGILAAAETHGRVFLIERKENGTIAAPVSPEAKAKHPVAVANARGEVLLAWTEGTAWAKGGAVAWQVLNRDRQPSEARGRAEGVPAWSLISAVAKPDGNFLLFY